MTPGRTAIRNVIFDLRPRWTLYALQLGWPRDQETVIQSLGANGVRGKTKVRSVGLLGSNGKLQFNSKPTELHIRVPAKAPV